MSEARNHKSLGWILAGMLGLGVINLVPASAEASIIVDFATSMPAGDTGSPTYVDASGVMATGFYFDDDENAWEMANLFVRNEPNDHGLGICNEREAPCPGPPWGGDVNEVDNQGWEEILRLSLPAGYRWVSVQISSIDDNGGRPEEFAERGTLWSSLNAAPNDPFDAALWDFDDGMGTEPTFAIPSEAASAPYLFFQPYDWLGETNTNNDFLVYKVEIERVDMPEPTSLALLGLGLFATGLYRHRQRS